MKSTDLQKWKTHYNDLKLFFEQFGHSQVPYRYAENPSLGRWVMRQRRNQNQLSDYQKAQLKKLNFVWSEQIRKDNYQTFLVMLRRLMNYKKVHGNCMVPSKYADDTKLGRWVETLRLQEKTNKLDDWKKVKLDAIGFVWSSTIQNDKQKHWYEMYSRLTAFYEKYGHSNVPENWEEDKQLSIWVMGQRRPKKPLKIEKRVLLHKLKFRFKFFDTTQRKRNEKGLFMSSTPYE